MRTNAQTNDLASLFRRTQGGGLLWAFLALGAAALGYIGINAATDRTGPELVRSTDPGYWRQGAGGRGPRQTNTQATQAPRPRGQRPGMSPRGPHDPRDPRSGQRFPNRGADRPGWVTGMHEVAGILNIISGLFGGNNRYGGWNEESMQEFLYQYPEVDEYSYAYDEARRNYEDARRGRDQARHAPFWDIGSYFQGPYYEARMDQYKREMEYYQREIEYLVRRWKCESTGRAEYCFGGAAAVRGGATGPTIHATRGARRA
jgi:hypothetical protein